jgi:hypothetical protein
VTDHPVPAVRPLPVAANSLLIRAAAEVERLGHLPEATRTCLINLGYTSEGIERAINNLRRPE